jgi:hypothetical protein
MTIPESAEAARAASSPDGLDAVVAELVAAAPPLSGEQRRQLAGLLAPKTPPAGQSAAA